MLTAMLNSNMSMAKTEPTKAGVDVNKDVKVETLAATSFSWDGATLPNYPTTTPKLTIQRYTFPPHKRLSRHVHHIINCGVMLRGELTLVSADEAGKTFKAGDALVEMFGKAH